MDIMGALAVIGQGIGIAKNLKEITDGYNTADYKAKMAELMGALADAKVALLDAQDELRSKDQEIERLKKSFELRADLVESTGFKFERKPDGTPRGEAFCPRCEQNKGRYYRLTRTAGGQRGELRCPECQAVYSHVPTYTWE